MLDFVNIGAQYKKDSIIITPSFIVKRSNDLMIRGNRFYAVWDEELGYWSTNEDDICRIIDKALYEYREKHYPGNDMIEVAALSNFSSKKWTEWQQYCKSLPDNYKELDTEIIFSNSKIGKRSYITRKLDYAIEQGDISAYQELVSTIYEPEELQKLEWAVGSIIAGDSKKIQKFIVLYGAPGTGKSTYLEIVQKLFPGYYTTFESKQLASNSASFALESFRSNPLIAIQHDGDLSRIEDNTKLNSIISHEEMLINEKFKNVYTIKLHSFLFMGTNKPVKITDAKSGLVRRLIDVSPSGNKVPRKRYDELLKQIEFELGGIAQHCLEVYQDLGSTHYDGYYPISMFGETNDIFNFIEDNFDLFTKLDEDGLSLKTAWTRYKEYVEDARVPYPMSQKLFKSELKNYFSEYYERYKQQRNVYKGFLKEKFEYQPLEKSGGENSEESWLIFDCDRSLLDDILKDCPAQYADGTKPSVIWDKVQTTLGDLQSNILHYVRPPQNLVVIDFDLKDSGGNKSFELNLKEASKWPKTYAETSMSGNGIHLHYWYEGDINELAHIFGDDIEIKTFQGKSSLRRCVSKCNDISIATINSGLPKREVKKVLTDTTIKSEQKLRELIERNLRKEIHPATKPSIDFIKKILDDAYESGLHYDVTDLRAPIQIFAINSSHQAENCLKMVSQMKFASEEPSENVDGFDPEEPIVFFDCEVFPNLFLICWKKQGDNKIVQMYNPKPDEVRELFKLKLAGYNNRGYDNHMLYAASMGYTTEELYRLSQRIIVDGDKNAKFGEAFNLSYTDVYDFLSPPHKQSLKKWEIQLHIHHQECPHRWDQPVPKEKWKEVGGYCDNDVIATEKVFEANQEDWTARQILAEWAGMTVNDTTNSLTTRIIVGKDPRPWEKFVYTDLSETFPGYRFDPFGIPKEEYNPDTKIVQGKSIYMGEDPSEGGYVYANPGIYVNVGLLDIVSMHPTSSIVMDIFGPYTINYSNIVEARKKIKVKDYDTAKSHLPEKLHHYLEDKTKAKQLAGALKGAINPVYGLTSAKFQNKLKDPRNVDNIVAKRGALFMIHLKNKVIEQGYTVVHIKTDSIKIANVDDYIIDFVMKEGEKYGYEFDHEATYSKICLVNDAVYIAEVAEEEGEVLEKRFWTATGTQFQIPYVFKKLFSKEPIDFYDICETKSVTSSMYLDMNEGLREDEHNVQFVGRVGCFVPVKPGVGGGILLRENTAPNAKTEYSAVNGTKSKSGKFVYRWIEDEIFKDVYGFDRDKIDFRYFEELCEDAIDAINKFGDFERFVNDDEGFMLSDNVEEEELPFSEKTEFEQMLETMDDYMNPPA